MCSGCSGDYAGGFDSDDPHDPIAGAGDGVFSASFRGTSDQDLSENDLSEKGLGETDLAEGTAGGRARLEVPEDASESCEILVTGTHIFEIRAISANWRGQDRTNDGFCNTRAALVSHAPSKHSSGESAKYYQTRRGSEKTRGYATRSVPISRSFAGVCKAKLKRWLQETRRLVRRCTPQSS